MEGKRGLLVDLTGIEPVTSSMPWNESNIKLLTARAYRSAKLAKPAKLAVFATRMRQTYSSGPPG